MRARTLDPILANAGVAAAYQKDLEKLIDDLFEAYSANIISELMSGEIVGDAKRKTPEEIREEFEREAERIARKFVGKSDKHCRAGLINALKKAGYSPADIRKLRQRPADMDAILERIVAENVALIRNIPEKVQKQIRAMVTKSAENNRDLGSLVEELKGLKEMTVRRARTISRDQNSKITEQVSILRVQTLGITQGVWMHRSIGKTYRKSHVAMHGKTFDLSAGMWDEDAGEWVLPGQLVNCGCTYKPVLPDLTQTPQPEPPTAGQSQVETKSTEVSKLDPYAATSTKDAEQFAIKNGIARSADFGKLDVRTANEINAVYLDARQLIPDMPLEDIGSCQALMTQNYEARLASYMTRLRQKYPNTDEAKLQSYAKSRIKKGSVSGQTFAFSIDSLGANGIGVNEKYFSKKAYEMGMKELKNCVDIGYHPPFCDTIKSVVDHEMAHRYANILNLEKDSEMLKIFRELSKSKSIESEVSGYAAKNIGEFISEAWAEYRNSPHPRKTAQDVGQRIEKLAEEYRKKRGL